LLCAELYALNQDQSHTGCATAGAGGGLLSALLLSDVACTAREIVCPLLLCAAAEEVNSTGAEDSRGEDGDCGPVLRTVEALLQLISRPVSSGSFSGSGIGGIGCAVESRENSAVAVPDLGDFSLLEACRADMLAGLATQLLAGSCTGAGAAGGTAAGTVAATEVTMGRVRAVVSYLDGAGLDVWGIDSHLLDELPALFLLLSDYYNRGASSNSSSSSSDNTSGRLRGTAAALRSISTAFGVDIAEPSTSTAGTAAGTGAGAGAGARARAGTSPQQPQALAAGGSCCCVTTVAFHRMLLPVIWRLGSSMAAEGGRSTVSNRSGYEAVSKVTATTAAAGTSAGLSGTRAAQLAPLRDLCTQVMSDRWGSSTGSSNGTKRARVSSAVEEVDEEGVTSAVADRLQVELLYILSNLLLKSWAQQTQDYQEQSLLCLRSLIVLIRQSDLVKFIPKVRLLYCLLLDVLILLAFDCSALDLLFVCLLLFVSFPLIFLLVLIGGAVFSFVLLL
jgi:hypothetical protein